MMRREYAERLLGEKIKGYSPDNPELSDYVKLFEVLGLAERAIFGTPIMVVHYVNRTLSEDRYVREELEKTSKHNTVFILYLLTEQIIETIKKYKHLPYLIWVADNIFKNETGLTVNNFFNKLYPFAKELELWGGSRRICVYLIERDLKNKRFKVKIREDCTFE